jgi:leader peptidase (prepilin peptidase)/N-methyltransferase
MHGFLSLYNTAMLGYLAIILIGLLGGMLVNYLADVLPRKRRLVRPFCLTCDQPQTLLNYWFWPRRCPICGKRRGIRVWLVEAIAIGASLWLWFSPPAELGWLGAWVLLLYFGVVTVIDLEHRLILHPVSLVGAVLGLGLGFWLHGWKSTLAGGVAGFVMMFLLYFLGDLFARLIARIRGETLDEVALGFGDVNLAGVLGLVLGWPGIVGGLLLAIMLGGLFSLLFLFVSMIRRRYRTFTAIPYGPFLIASAVLLLFFRDSIQALIQ